MLAVTAGLLLALLVAPGTALAGKKKPADLVIKNANVYTVDADWSTAQAVAVRNGRIVFIGSNTAATRYIGPGTQLVNAKGNMVLPAFSDAHAHAGMTVASLYAVSLWFLPTVEDYVATVAEFAAANPDLEWIRGEGWSNTVVPGIGPLASDLDAVVSDRPVAITSEDYHSLWVNSKTLEIAGIDKYTQDPVGGVIERIPGTADPANGIYGVPSGTLRESASTMVQELIPDYSLAQYKEGILAYQDWIAGPYGITTVFDPLIEVGERAAQAYEELAQEGLLAMRVRGALALDPEDDVAAKLEAFAAEQSQHTTPYFQTPAVKMFVDGVIEGHTGYLKEPYADAEEYAGDASYRGTPLWEPDALAQAFTAVDEAGFQIHVHSIGDAATSELLDALEVAQAANGVHDWRPGVTHIQLVSSDDFARFADLGVTAVPQPYWFMKDDYYTYLQVPYLGFPRADEEYPMKSFFDAGVHVASASDFPVTWPPDPLDGIQLGVMRWFPGWVWEFPPPPSLEGVLWPEERVTAEQMIQSFTIEGAYASYLEGETGSLEIGKSADIIIVNRDITTCDPEKIGKSKVLLTLFEGKTVFATDGY
jgi:predicted amidohydrolase YtcJ